MRWKWTSQATARTPGFQRLRGLVARARRRDRGNDCPGCEVEQRHDGLRADVLHAVAARCDVLLGLRAARRARSPRRPPRRSAAPSGPAATPGRRARSRAMGHATGSRSTLRRMALTNPAAEVLRARLTSSHALGDGGVRRERAPGSGAGRCPCAARCGPRDRACARAPE